MCVCVCVCVCECERVCNGRCNVPTWHGLIMLWLIIRYMVCVQYTTLALILCVCVLVCVVCV